MTDEQKTIAERVLLKAVATVRENSVVMLSDAEGLNRLGIAYDARLQDKLKLARKIADGLAAALSTIEKRETYTQTGLIAADALKAYNQAKERDQ